MKDGKNSAYRRVIVRGEGLDANSALSFHVGGNSGDESSGTDGSSQI
jgi:hypothetical protein